MTSYNNVFGGPNVQPATVSYAIYGTIASPFTANIQLNWATNFVDNNFPVAQTMDLNPGLALQPIVGPLANNPITTGAANSGIVTVTVVSTAFLHTGEMVTISGATTTDGITALQLNITAAITVVDATHFTYVTAGMATAGGTAGGGAVVFYQAGAPLSLKMPDATMVSVGQTTQINNISANSVNILDFAGNIIVTIGAGLAYSLYLRINTTSAGGWGFIQNGAIAAAAQAGPLAGFGLINLNNELNINFTGKTLAANYQVLPADRASLLVWTGGSGTITLPVFVAGFDVSVNNDGSGLLIVQTPDGYFIDSPVRGNSTSFNLNPGESATFIALIGGAGPQWNSLGYGVETVFSVNANTIDVGTPNVPTITLTNQQAANLVLKFTGVLLQNVIVVFPATPGQWYIWNATTGAFSLTVKLNGIGVGVVIPQGQKLIIYSDGTEMYNTPTVSTSVVFADGNVGAPGISFTAQSSTGFYRIASGVTGYSGAGSQGLTFSSPGAADPYGIGISSGLAARFYNIANTQYVGFKAGVLAANTIWTLPLADATIAGQIIRSDAAGNLAFTTASYPATIAINQLLYASAANTISALATANNGVLVTNGIGVPGISTTLPNATQDNITRLGTIASITTPLGVPFGGTGLATLTTAYGVVCAGTTATGSLQNAGAGTLNQVLTSNGAAALPSWKNVNIALPAAVKADEIAAASTTVYTNPAVQQFHPSAVKFWCYFNGTTAGTNAPLAGYNVTNVQRISPGIYQVNFTVPFTTANYGLSHTVGFIGPNTATLNPTALNTTNVQFQTSSVAAVVTAGDSTFVFISGYGTQ